MPSLCVSKLKLSLAFLLLLPLCRAVKADDDKLQILTEDSPPLSFERNGAASGIAVDLVREIQHRIGNSDPINVVPWARSYHLAMHEKNVVIFPCNRTEQREKLFNWVGPIYTFHFQIFAKADNNYMISNIEDAKKFKTIGVARDFYSDQVLTQLGFANLDRSTTPSSMLLKLINNRIQLMADDDLGMMGLLQEVNADNAAIKPVFRLFDVQTYVCLSHDTKPSIVAQWQHTLDEMRRDGSFSKLVTDRLPQQR